MSSSKNDRRHSRNSSNFTNPEERIDAAFINAIKQHLKLEDSEKRQLSDSVKGFIRRNLGNLAEEKVNYSVIYSEDGPQQLASEFISNCLRNYLYKDLFKDKYNKNLPYVSKKNVGFDTNIASYNLEDLDNIFKNIIRNKAASLSLNREGNYVIPNQIEFNTKETLNKRLELLANRGLDQSNRHDMNKIIPIDRLNNFIAPLIGNEPEYGSIDSCIFEAFKKGFAPNEITYGALASLDKYKNAEQYRQKKAEQERRGYYGETCEGDDDKKYDNNKEPVMPAREGARSRSNTPRELPGWQR